MDLFPNFVPDDPPKEPPHPGFKPIFDDMPDWRPAGASKVHLHQKYFTPAEKQALEAIPADDLTSEIKLLRVLLARCLAIVPRYTGDRKIPPLPLKLFTSLMLVFSRTANVIGSLVSLQWRMHNPTDEWGRLVLEALRELDPDKEL